MNLASLRRFVRQVGTLLVALAGTLGAVPSDPGIYAVVNVTWGNPDQLQTGSFTIRLEYEKTPLTVANFVTLAEGTRPWLDTRHGTLHQTPFYNGLIFHRVARQWMDGPLFVLQGGSPAGDGSDGPGYVFADEFRPELRHNKAGIVSMANSGIQSNGSQFFITYGAFEHLDDSHTVFGEVVENFSVVQAIGQTPVNPITDEPLDPVTMVSVEIVRQGAAAQAWDPMAYPLPEVFESPASMSRDWSTPGKAVFNWPRPGAGEVFVYRTANFEEWGVWGVVMDHEPSVVNGVDLTSMMAAEQKLFFRTVRAQYPDPILTPAVVRGKRAVVTIPANNLTVWIDFTQSSKGTKTYIPGGGTEFTQNIEEDFFRAEPLRLLTGFNEEGGGGWYYTFVFTSPTEGYGRRRPAWTSEGQEFTFTWGPIP
jgi:cyclophilin family peptidyl-prolyl cis-trans isomerase